MLQTTTTPKTRYIFVTGGVLSGVGKGTITSSIAKLLKEQGYVINVIKIDPYLNYDAGTMRPTEHGEVFVTYDGGETDQDIGNYERFLDQKISKENNITSGQVYYTVINRERNLAYEGKCVSVIPHFPDEVKRRIRKSSIKTNADFTLVEVGGTTGDYENVLFLEALREMKLEREQVMFVHVVYLPVPNNIGEMKTKPAQHSIRELNARGIQPDFIITRSKHQMDNVRRKKLASFANLSSERVISSPDVPSIYDIPLLFEDEGLTQMILSQFALPFKENTLTEWKEKSDAVKALDRPVTIGIVGKYFETGNFILEDSYVSVIEAIKHAGYATSIKPDIGWIDAKQFEENPDTLSSLDTYDAVIIPGGFGTSGIEGKIAAIRYCRQNDIPFLGLCYGLQLATVEFARTVCNIPDAHTTEVKTTTNPVIDILPEQKELLKNKQYGATMRLGEYPAHLKPETKVYQLYNQAIVHERHRHRYEVNPDYHTILSENGLVFSGLSPDKRLVEFIELSEHPFFIATQAHPEFNSSIETPHPLFLGLIAAAMQKENRYQ
jgi:CTP synthase